MICKKMTKTPSSRITKTGGGNVSHSMSHVKRRQLLASPVKLIFCGLSPFYKIWGTWYTIRMQMRDEILFFILRRRSDSHSYDICAPLWQYCQKEFCYQTVERYPRFEQYCKPHICESTYFYSVKKYFKNFAEIMAYIFLNPHASYTRDGNMTMSLLTYLLTYSMEQSPSWEANWFCS